MANSFCALLYRKTVQGARFFMTLTTLLLPANPYSLDDCFAFCAVSDLSKGVQS